MKRILSLALFGLVTGTTGATDLIQVYQDALSHDAQFASARAQSTAGQERRAQGLAGLLPSVNASASTQYNDTDIKEPYSATARYNTNNWGVQLTQPLFRLQNYLQYRQGELAAEAATVQLASERQTLMLRVASAYFDLLNANEQLASIVAQKSASEQQLELAKKSFEVGTTTITDVHEAQSRFDLAVASEAAATASVEVKRQTLVQITGKDPGVLAPLREGVRFQRPQPDDMQGWASNAEQSNLSVQAAQLAHAIAEREVQRNRAGHLPTVDATLQYGHSHSQTLGTSSNANSTVLGIQIAVPIYSGGYTQSKVRESEALREKALADLENARRSAALNARQAYLGVTSGIAQVAGYEAALVSSRSAVESNKLGYQVGVRINIDVLNAETQFFDTFRQLSRARYDTLVAQLKLKNAAGALTEDDLKAVNALLDPAAAGNAVKLPTTAPAPLEKADAAEKAKSDTKPQAPADEARPPAHKKGRRSQKVE